MRERRKAVTAKIAIVDDDDALRDSLGVLLRFRDYTVVEFATGEALLEHEDLNRLDCLILDLRMPGMSGLEVLKACRARGITVPVIVVTAFGDVASAKGALKSGAFDFIEKPIDGEEMIRLVEEALEQYRQSTAVITERSSIEERLARLSGRERQILDFVLQGKHNREIAAALELSVRTVEVYKARMMEKMRVSRLAELIRLFAKLEAPAA
jgi:FixJ family two-component response regulator